MKEQKTNPKDQQQTLASKEQPEAGNGGTATLEDNRASTVVQGKLRKSMDAAVAPKATFIQRKVNNTGLPNNLKSGIENLSGFAMDDVKVHYNSSKPAQLQAHAFAQGSDIHLAPGQEKHLSHEAWHVVQQKQGRVQPTRQLKSKVAINDDAGLEREADVMGEKAMQSSNSTQSGSQLSVAKVTSHNPIQRIERLLRKEYKFESQNDEPLATTQSEELKFREVHAYEKKESEEGEEAKVVPDPPTTKKKGKNKKTNIKEFNGYSLEPLPVSNIDESYTDQPEFMIEREYFDIFNRTDAQILISDDKTIAINRTPKEPSKEFYATDDVIEEANEALKEVNSSIKLVKINNAKIKLKKSGATLTKVVPKLEDSDNISSEIEALRQSVCIELASAIMGNRSIMNGHNVLFNGDTPEMKISSARKSGDKRVLKKIRKKAKGADGARKMGINEFVNPDVGQGYATFSYEEKGDTQGKKRWGYHFGAVVAKSEDGKDNITLENVNREKSVVPIMHQILDTIWKKYMDELKDFKFKGSPEELDTRQMYGQVKAYLLNINVFTALKMHDKIANSLDLSEAWSFQIYGTRKGQDFHSRQVASDHFVNPTTLRVTKDKPLPKAKNRLNMKLFGGGSPKMEG